jgi:hypothetical protein
MFPAEPGVFEEATSARHDPKILGLARDHVSLDVFEDFASRGGLEGVLRVRGSLLSYHAAMHQASPDVAVILMATGMEALTTPAQPWGKEKVTKRFIEGTIELCPEAVDAALAHANVEEAFAYQKRGGQNRQRKELLDRVYELRSTPSHAGLGLSGGAGLVMLDQPESMRVAIMSDLARAALLAFLQAPRSFLIGHPMFDGTTGAV